MKPLIHKFDTAVSNVITAWPTNLGLFFVIITTMGSPVITCAIGLAIVGFGYYKNNWRLSLAGVSIWATMIIDSAIKLLVGRARPATEYAENMIIRTNSFPSGHSAGSMIAYGLLAYLAWNLLPQPWNYIVAVILALLIILIGISRVYLGAHFPSDVVAGWLLGAVVLLAVILWRPL